MCPCRVTASTALGSSNDLPEQPSIVAGGSSGVSLENCTIYDHLKPFWTIWNHWAPFGTIWDLRPLGTTNHLGRARTGSRPGPGSCPSSIIGRALHIALLGHFWWASLDQKFPGVFHKGRISDTIPIAWPNYLGEYIAHSTKTPNVYHIFLRALFNRAQQRKKVTTRPFQLFI